ncbi:hypothetical protein N7G274_003689 [Stereocaulon virgatum]|uniref:Transcriptional regulatory protein RXT2 N-terminal domain-containing protein n=1 Tax=Stereocaulon virgatum TaxID=373712 RepID=A0ABR4AE93_9LECA
MAQAALIADTIAGMKRAIARHQDSSDSDEPYLQPTNRGNKLKRKAHHIRDGQSGRSRGPKVYKRSIEYAGYKRHILRRNPKRYDGDGDEIPSDESDEEADARAAENNPYVGIRLEELLLPLTSAANLPDHPSLSVPYISTTLTDMVQQACVMVQRERRTLSNAKQLLTKFRGDMTWIPCGLLYSESDEEIFDTRKLYKNIASGRTSHYSDETAAPDMVNGNLNGDTTLDIRLGSKGSMHFKLTGGAGNETHEDPAAASSIATNETVTNSTLPPDSPTKEALEELVVNATSDVRNVEMAQLEDKVTKKIIAPGIADESNRRPEEGIVNAVGPETFIVRRERPGSTKDEEMVSAPEAANHEMNITRTITSLDYSMEGFEPAAKAVDAPISNDTAPEAQGGKEEDEEVDLEDENDSRRAPRRMRTRAQAQAASEPTPSSRANSPDSWVTPEIHPLFLIPQAAFPDKDFGLPPSEADETRRMLTMYVQKQEEVCRGAERIYDGLLEADRKRKTVFKWCKAEGHVGEMSDGEDWYDKDEWDLDDDLRKGHNDDEDDNVIQGKKTRGRRA